jgi:hypothetical protein
MNMTQFRDALIDDAQIATYCASEQPVIARLAQEVRRLRDGIREHRAQSGHALCWLNDVALWRLLEDDPTYPHDTLPVREEFLANCRRYYQSRLDGTPWVDPAPESTVTGDR